MAKAKLATKPATIKDKKGPPYGSPNETNYNTNAVFYSDAVRRLVTSPS